MILLSAVFIRRVPSILNAGKNTGTIKKAFSEVVRLIFGREKIGSLFVLYPIVANTINTILNEINSGIVDNGVS